MKLEIVEVTKNGVLRCYYSDDEFGKTVVDSAQVQFDYYLKQIRKAKIKQCLEDLK